MLTRTKWMIAGLATAALLGTAVAAAAEDPEIDADASVSASESWHGKDWTKDNGTVRGKYVSFSFDARTGAVTNYAEQGRVLFASIALADYNASDARAQAHGRTIVATDGDLLRAMVFDARNAAFAMRSPAGNTVTLVVPDGVSIEYHAGEKGWSPEGVLLRDGNRTARLVVEGDANVTVSGQTITVVLGEHGGLRYKIEGHPWEDAKEKLALLKLRHKAREHKEKQKGRAQASVHAKGKGRVDA